MDYLDYTNEVYFFLSGILMFASFILLLIFEKGIMRKLFYLIFVLAMGIPYMIGYQNYHTITKNIKEFRDHKSLECYSGTDSYLVSKQRGWELDGEKFLKEDLLVSVHRCSLREGK